jgi:hypothetical protein
MRRSLELPYTDSPTVANYDATKTGGETLGRGRRLVHLTLDDDDDDDDGGILWYVSLCVGGILSVAKREKGRKEGRKKEEERGVPGKMPREQ